jgi:hypothetical protein
MIPFSPENRGYPRTGFCGTARHTKSITTVVVWITAATFSAFRAMSASLVRRAIADVISLPLKLIDNTSRDIDPFGSESLLLVMRKHRNIDIMARVVLLNL